MIPPAQQGFHENGGAPPDTHRVAGAEYFLDGPSRDFDRAVDIASSGLLLGKTDVYEPSPCQREALLQGGFANGRPARNKRVTA